MCQSERNLNPNPNPNATQPFGAHRVQLYSCISGGYPGLPLKFIVNFLVPRTNESPWRDMAVTVS